jgi:CHASE3 domain sensor protein
MADAGTTTQPRTEPRRRAPARTIALLLVVALATGLFFLATANRVQNEEKGVIALQALRAEVATAQSSVRGYTLVASPRFLAPYRVAVPAVDRTFDELDAAMEEDDPRRVVRAERLFGDWRRRFAEPTIDLVRHRRSDDAEALARTGSGKRRIDLIQVLVADEIAEENQEIDDTRRVEKFLGTLAIAGIAALCLAVGLAWRRPPPRP